MTDYRVEQWQITNQNSSMDQGCIEGQFRVIRHLAPQNVHNATLRVCIRYSVLYVHTPGTTLRPHWDMLNLITSTSSDRHLSAIPQSDRQISKGVHPTA